MRQFILFFVAGAALCQEPAAQVPAAPAPSASPSAETPGVKSIGTMKEIMVNWIFPTSNEVFYVGREEKKSEKDWMDLQNNSLMLAESANILMAPNRAYNKAQWMKDAKLLQDVAAKAFKMAKAKDLEGLEGLNDELYESCQSCHEHYRPGYKRRL